MLFKCVGPMPVSEFMTKFTPDTSPTKPTTAGFKLDKPQAESDILGFEALDLCPHLCFSSVPKIDDASTPSDPAQQKTCIAALSKSQPPGVPSQSIHFPPCSNPNPELLIDYVQSDPFKEPDATNAPNRKRFDIRRLDRKSKDIFAPHLKFVRALFGSHSYVFFFSILVMDDAARLLRWDRSGAIVSERFEWTSPSNPLSDFLWKFGHMTPEDRGFDTTFSSPSPEEATLALAAFQRSDKISISPEDPLRKVSVRDDVTGQDHLYVVAAPQSSHGAFFGSCTTGYVAFDLSRGVLVWLKDTWKSQSSSTPEGDIYRRMAEKDVPHVPTLCCAGEVSSQRTICKDFVKADWACASTRIGTYRHYRLVLGEIGRPLDTFTSTHELCIAIRDAVEAHAHAYRELGILHGDISAGNILITDSGRGLLLDCHPHLVRYTTFLRWPIQGTWKFISAALMEQPRETEHVLVDDLESFLHVFVFHVVRHRPTGIPNLIDILDNIYYSGMQDNEPEVNGMHKVAFLSGGIVRLGQLRGHLNEPCYNLVVELRGLFWRGRYAYDSDIPTEERREKERALESSDRILAMFDAAVEGDGWSDGDGSRDIVKEIRERTRLRKATRVAHYASKRASSDAFRDGSDEQGSGLRKTQRA
ncbi:hypothetical protein OF83DRAFT_1151462 [Amylostereum chailletii]|nr:hypothetical protein OF83DRAFT_1151462 [Amylostereum chailletii]